MYRRARKLPRSRKEIRARAAISSSPVPAEPPAIVHRTPVAPLPESCSSCLHTPYECSVYRYPPEWCSSCKVKAASMAAQAGLPDMRQLVYPSHAFAQCAPGMCRPDYRASPACGPDACRSGAGGPSMYSTGVCEPIRLRSPACGPMALPVACTLPPSLNMHCIPVCENRYTH